MSERLTSSNEPDTQQMAIYKNYIYKLAPPGVLPPDLEEHLAAACGTETGDLYRIHPVIVLDYDSSTSKVRVVTTTSTPKDNVNDTNVYWSIGKGEGYQVQIHEDSPKMPKESWVKLSSIRTMDSRCLVPWKEDLKGLKITTNSRKKLMGHIDDTMGNMATATALLTATEDIKNLQTTTEDINKCLETKPWTQDIQQIVDTTLTAHNLALGTSHSRNQSTSTASDDASTIKPDIKPKECYVVHGAQCTCHQRSPANAVKKRINHLNITFEGDFQGTDYEFTLLVPAWVQAMIIVILSTSVGLLLGGYLAG